MLKIIVLLNPKQSAHKGLSYINYKKYQIKLESISRRNTRVRFLKILPQQKIHPHHFYIENKVIFLNDLF